VLRNKVILAVDDEPDVLDTIVEVLDLCRVDTAGHYDKAVELLQSGNYDMVILDVMGVKGLHLLESSVNRKFPTVMLTAPALNPEYILQSMRRGAISYISKEDLVNLDTLLSDLLAIVAEGGSTWRHTMKRLEPLLDASFPPDWRQRYESLLE
jgi:DNA-binding NtrC family response regulator